MIPVLALVMGGTNFLWRHLDIYGEYNLRKMKQRKKVVNYSWGTWGKK
jgi:hypothetical protein